MYISKPVFFIFILVQFVFLFSVQNYIDPNSAKNEYVDKLNEIQMSHAELQNGIRQIENKLSP